MINFPGRKNCLDGDGRGGDGIDFGGGDGGDGGYDGGFGGMEVEEGMVVAEEGIELLLVCVFMTLLLLFSCKQFILFFLSIFVGHAHQLPTTFDNTCLLYEFPRVLLAPIQSSKTIRDHP